MQLIRIAGFEVLVVLMVLSSFNGNTISSVQLIRIAGFEVLSSFYSNTIISATYPYSWF